MSIKAIVAVLSLFLTGVSQTLFAIGSPHSSNRLDSLPLPSQSDTKAAWDSFNTVFFNPAEAVYFHASDRKGRAAIWTQAIFWDMAMDMYQWEPTAKNLDRLKTVYQGALDVYDNFNWRNQKTWFIYDDMMWWIIALARANQLTGNEEYLKHAVDGFTYVWNEAHDSIGGGMYWQFEHKSKHACICFPTIIAALRIYQITNDEEYLEKAKRLYQWSLENLTDQKTGRVADSWHGPGKLGWSDYTYNQGTYIGAAVLLYQITNDREYLEQARAGANYTRNKMCNSVGVLPAEGDWNEQGILKSIFAGYMFELIDVTRDNDYLHWMDSNLRLAWKNRDQSRLVMFRDYTIQCPTGTIQSYEASSALRIMMLMARREELEN